MRNNTLTLNFFLKNVENKEVTFSKYMLTFFIHQGQQNDITDHMEITRNKIVKVPILASSSC